MKKVLIFLLASSGLLVACTSGDNPLVVTDQEVAQSLAYSMAEDQNGVLAQFNDAIAYADSIGICAFSGDSVIHKQNESSSTSKFDYLLNYNFERTCNGSVPNTFKLNASGNGEYNASKMSATDNLGLALTISGLAESSTFNTINASYTRVGSFKSKILSLLNFDNNIKLNLLNVSIDKTSGKAVLGTATAKVITKTGIGKKYYFDGTITFLGERTAVIKINGKSFIFDIVSGEIIK